VTCPEDYNLHRKLLKLPVGGKIKLYAFVTLVLAARRKQAEHSLLYARCLLFLPFVPEDGGRKFLRYAGKTSTVIQNAMPQNIALVAANDVKISNTCIRCCKITTKII
jgi:hypothetical protein